VGWTFWGAGWTFWGEGWTLTGTLEEVGADFRSVETYKVRFFPQFSARQCSEQGVFLSKRQSRHVHHVVSFRVSHTSQKGMIALFSKVQLTQIQLDIRSKRLKIAAEGV
jgi:hypothetical protein